MSSLLTVGLSDFAPYRPFVDYCSLASDAVWSQLKEARLFTLPGQRFTAVTIAGLCGTEPSSAHNPLTGIGGAVPVVGGECHGESLHGLLMLSRRRVRSGFSVCAPGRRFK